MKRWQADALLLLVAAIWGLAFVPQSWGMKDLGPMAFTGLRFVLGALVVAPLVMHKSMAMLTLILAFLPSVGLGAVLGWFGVQALRRAGWLDE